MRTAYSYIRFSTPEQRKGNSLERQLEASRILAERHGWRLDASLRFSDLGRSAFKAGQQVELERFLKAIEEGTVKPGSVLIIERLDRFSRQDIDVALQLFLRIIQAGVDIATLNPDTVHTRSSIKNIAGLIVPIVELAEANAASSNKSLRAIDNWQRKRQRGGPLTARCPAWLRLEGDKFVLIPAKAKVVQQIFRWSIEGIGERRICKRLNESGVENIAFGTKANCRKTWNERYVDAILRNRQAIGEYQPYRLIAGQRIAEGPPLAGYYPAVITEETFDAVQAAKRSRFKPRGPTGYQTANLFTGLLFDARTGSTMRVVNSSATEKKNGNYRRLASYHSTNGAAPFISWQLKHFEESFLKFVQELAAADILAPAEESRLPALLGRLAMLEERKAGIEAEILTEADYKSLVRTLKQLSAEITAVEAEIAAERIQQAAERQNVPSEAVKLIDLLANAKGKERQKLRDKLRWAIRVMVSEIWMLVDETRIYDDEPKSRFCMVQVFFHGGGHRQLMLWRTGYKVYSHGNGGRDDFAPCMAFDLRFWRYHCSPVFGGVIPSYIEQEPLPTPDGSDGFAYAMRQAKTAELAAAGG